MVKPVLIADDSPVARLMLSRRLRAEGLSVDERGSVAEARGAVAPSLGAALLDLDLGDPDADGVDVALLLRAADPSLPIAFFTSEDSEATRERAVPIGPIFAKPTDLDHAVAWVAKNVRR